MQALQIDWNELNTTVSDLVHNLYQKLFSGGLLLAIAILCLTLCLSLFFIMRSQRKGYVNSFATPKVYHYLLILATAVSGIYLIIQLIRGKVPLIAIIPVLAAAFAVYGLLRFRSFGPPASILFFWCAAWLIEQNGLLAAISDSSNIDNFYSIAKIAVYSSSDIIVMKAVGLEIILAVFTVFTVRYYAQRRFLFLHLRKMYLDPLTRCPKCSAYAVSEDGKCPFCRTDFSGTGYTVPDFVVLDKPRYERESISEKIREDIKGKIKTFIIFVIVIVLIFIPVLVSRFYSYLTSGYAAANNEYVDRIVELWDNRSVADDEEWIASYNDSAEALYNVNLRVYNFNPRRIKSNNMLFYIAYSEAVTAQILRMDDIANAINNKDFDNLEQLLAGYDQTIKQRDAALRSDLKDSIANLHSGSNLSEFPLLLVESLRFYTAFLPLTVWAIIILFFALIFLFAAVRIVMINRGILIPPYAESALADETACINSDQEKYQKGVRTERLLGIAISAAVVIVILIIIFFTRGTKPEDEYRSFMNTAVMDTPADIILWIRDAKADPESALSPERTDEICETIEKQVGALEHLLWLRENEVDKEYKSVYENIITIAPDLSERLQGMLSSIEAGNIPSFDQMSICYDLEEKIMSYGTIILMLDIYGSIGNAIE